MSALQLTGFRATVDAASVASRRPELTVEAARLRLSEEGLRCLIPVEAPLDISLDRIAPGRILFGGKLWGFPFTAEVRLSTGPSGCLRSELVAVRAGFITIPGFAVLMAFRSRLPQIPGLVVTEDDQIDVDLSQLAAPHGVRLPPLKAIGAGEGILEIDF
jgi:hypothetical protein